MVRGQHGLEAVASLLSFKGVRGKGQHEHSDVMGRTIGWWGLLILAVIGLALLLSYLL